MKAPRGGDATSLELVVFTSDGVTTHALPAQGQVSVGRATDNDVRVDDPSVSRRHAVLHLGDELAIEDLGGHNGTFVRERVSEPGQTAALRRLSSDRVALSVGDCVLVGSVALAVRKTRASEVTSIDQTPPRDAVTEQVYDQAMRAAESTISVLILGETGAGKEVLARAIHARSPRAAAPFVAINCGALPESLLESELFGNEKGAFSGAVQARAGLFETATRGSVFLDEVGELPPAVQVKLLRVLDEHAVMRVGGREARRIDVRFIAATNRDLPADVAAGRFRQDLFYRLSALTLEIPPLRQRRGEILALADVFAAVAAGALGRPTPHIRKDTAALLEAHAWPGNVRELKNVVERAVVLSTTPEITPDLLPQSLLRTVASDEPRDAPASSPVDKLKRQMKDLERDRILDALDRCGGNQTEAAELLGMSRRTLVSRLSEFDIPRPRKRS